ncbi:alpha/beta hydrolase [Algoriphagus sp. CAU 1675]|uniref:alpha/beta hydrolase n=1 Tax=Algoriphagus sp. CAU 1675 TaxID=3032597 RepID=UPI0023DCC1B1|nr:alpha/beta hydrolase [Algoriphagus sp. CAU 1675]MDF2157070.1 alpha/beta hydrolase [Algoriphagus sp. CAU 1675]
MKKILTLVFLYMTISISQAQNHILPLWEGTPPLQTDMGLKEEATQEGILRIGNVQTPSIEVYLPTRQIATGKAVVIFPGGGYSILAYDWEGTDFAKWLNSQGIAGIVVKYRLPRSKSLTDPKEVPLLDAQRAIRLVRQHASEWDIDPAQVGVMGFSAGGHLASTLSTQYLHEIDRKKDEVDALSARPDFSILVYPVISFRDAAVHSGSRNNLIGENAPQELIDRFSGELNVNSETPPTFLVHAQDDKGVPIENSLLYYRALHQQGVSASLHIYPTGGHGFAFGLGKGAVESWRDVLLAWIKEITP